MMLRFSQGQGADLVDDDSTHAANDHDRARDEEENRNEPTSMS